MLDGASLAVFALFPVIMLSQATFAAVQNSPNIHISSTGIKDASILNWIFFFSQSAKTMIQ